jgi:hypothetical protein
MIFPSRSSVARQETSDLERRDLAEYGVARFRDQIFDAVTALWRRRKNEGWTQKQVADAIGRDPGWVSKNLRAPGNWTSKTAGELIQGLNGEAEVYVYAFEEAPQMPRNYDAYDGYLSVKPMKHKNVLNTSSLAPKPKTIDISGQQTNQIEVRNNPVISITVGPEQ